MKTFAELYDPAMEIQTQSEADVYFRQLVIYYTTLGKSQTESEAIARTNLGYWAGYYNEETRERVERLFNCEHPVFGKFIEKGSPTPEEAFKMGMEWWEKHKK